MELDHLPEESSSIFVRDSDHVALWNPRSSIVSTIKHIKAYIKLTGNWGGIGTWSVDLGTARLLALPNQVDICFLVPPVVCARSSLTSSVR